MVYFEHKWGKFLEYKNKQLQKKAFQCVVHCEVQRVGIIVPIVHSASSWILGDTNWWKVTDGCVINFKNTKQMLRPVLFVNLQKPANLESL